MENHRREAWRRKYLSLGTGELVAAAGFAAIAAYVVTPRFDNEQDSAALWSALIPLLTVLVQAGVYWLLARSWIMQSRMPTTLAATYRAFRVANVALLAGGLIGIIVWFPDHTGAALLVVAVWLFGAVEYLNYFVVRLSYPVTQWLIKVGQRRTPRLIKDASSPAR